MSSFVDRALSRLPAGKPQHYVFESWDQGRSTKEGLGIIPIAGVDVDKVVAAIFDFDHYKGNVKHVVESRAIADARFEPPAAQRFYQRINIPGLGDMHYELVMRDLGEKKGYRVLAWETLGPETDKLDAKKGARSEYNEGAWFVAPGVLGYALASAPRKADVGRIKFAVLTKGADASAKQVLQGNIEGMASWASRR